jgi:hypothetical protein
MFDWLKKKQMVVIEPAMVDEPEIVRAVSTLQPNPNATVFAPVAPLPVLERDEPACEHLRYTVVGGGGRRCSACGFQPDLFPASGLKVGFGRFGIEAKELVDGKVVASRPQGSAKQGIAEGLARWLRGAK